MAVPQPMNSPMPQPTLLDDDHQRLSLLAKPSRTLHLTLPGHCSCRWRCSYFMRCSGEIPSRSAALAARSCPHMAHALTLSAGGPRTLKQSAAVWPLWRFALSDSVIPWRRRPRRLVGARRSLLRSSWPGPSILPGAAGTVSATAESKWCGGTGGGGKRSAGGGEGPDRLVTAVQLGTRCGDAVAQADRAGR